MKRKILINCSEEGNHTLIAKALIINQELEISILNELSYNNCNAKCCSNVGSNFIELENDLLTESDEQPCIKLINNQCSDYENRPVSCKLYPYMIELLTQRKEQYLIITANCSGIPEYKKPSNEYLSKIKEIMLYSINNLKTLKNN